MCIKQPAFLLAPRVSHDALLPHSSNAGANAQPYSSSLFSSHVDLLEDAHELEQLRVRAVVKPALNRDAVVELVAKGVRAVVDLRKGRKGGRALSE